MNRDLVCSALFGAVGVAWSVYAVITGWLSLGEILSAAAVGAVVGVVLIVVAEAVRGRRS